MKAKDLTAHVAQCGCSAKTFRRVAILAQGIQIQPRPALATRLHSFGQQLGQLFSAQLWPGDWTALFCTALASRLDASFSSAQLWPADWTLLSRTALASRLDARLGVDSMSFQWNMSSTETWTGDTTLKDLFAAIAVIMHSELWLQTVEWACAVDRYAMETLSNEGYCYMDKRNVDLGNWKYAFLWCSVARLSRRANRAIDQAMTRISQRYSSLRVDASFTIGTIETQGDIIECMLATSRQTGIAVAVADCNIRLAFNAAVRQYSRLMDTVLQRTFRNIVACGPPRSWQMLPASMCSRCLLTASCLASGPSHRSMYEHAFELDVRTMRSYFDEGDVENIVF